MRDTCPARLVIRLRPARERGLGQHQDSCQRARRQHTTTSNLNGAAATSRVAAMVCAHWDGAIVSRVTVGDCASWWSAAQMSARSMAHALKRRYQARSTQDDCWCTLVADAAALRAGQDQPAISSVVLATAPHVAIAPLACAFATTDTQGPTARSARATPSARTAHAPNKKPVRSCLACRSLDERSEPTGSVSVRRTGRAGRAMCHCPARSQTRMSTHAGTMAAAGAACAIATKVGSGSRVGRGIAA